MLNKLNKQVQQIKKRLIEKYKPVKIVLFGSAVLGRLNKNSDIDIFMVKKTSLPFTERYLEVTRLFPKRDFPIDFIVYTPQEYAKALQEKRFFLEEVLHKGKLLYEKS